MGEELANDPAATEAARLAIEVQTPPENPGEVTPPEAANVGEVAVESTGEIHKELGKEIYQGVQDLLDKAEDFQGIGPKGWKKSHRTPSYISAQFQHNTTLQRLRGAMNPPTELFTERLRIQETNVVVPYERIEGDKIRLELIEMPANPKASFYGDDKDLIKDAKRLDISISPDGDIQVDSYLAGDGRAWGDVIEGPGTFGHGDRGVKSETIPFGEEAAKHVLSLIKDIRSDIKAVSRGIESDEWWDKQKAETMAAALQADGRFDKLEKDIRFDQGEGYGVYDQEKGSEKLNERADEVLSPYEELYDLNSAKFAEMPTAEFMKIAKELASYTEDIETAEYTKEYVARWQAELQQAIEARKAVDSKVIDKFMSDISESNLLEDNEEWYREGGIVDQLESSLEDTYSKSPQQINESVAKLFESAIAILDKYQAADKERRQAILDAHKPEEVQPEQS